jgi:hypothetical protein
MVVESRLRHFLGIDLLGLLNINGANRIQILNIRPLPLPLLVEITEKRSLTLLVNAPQLRVAEIETILVGRRRNGESRLRMVANLVEGEKLGLLRTRCVAVLLLGRGT